MRPIREIVFKWDQDATPTSYREIAFVTMGAINEIGKALHRIADILDRTEGKP